MTLHWPSPLNAANPLTQAIGAEDAILRQAQESQAHVDAMADEAARRMTTRLDKTDKACLDEFVRAARVFFKAEQ